MLNEFLESFRTRFVVSSIIRMKFFFFFYSSLNCITFKWLNLESIIIFRSLPFVITFVSSFFLLIYLVSWSHTNCFVSFSMKKFQFYMKLSSTRFPGPSYQFLLSPFILLTYRIVHHSGSWPRSPTNYPNEKQFNNFIEWRQQTMNYLLKSTNNAETKQTVTNKFQSKTRFFFFSKPLKWKEAKWTFFLNLRFRV